MGVDVAPVVQLAALQPRGAGQRLPAVAGAKDDEGAWQRREGEEVGLVFGDENALNGQGQGRKAGGIEGDVGQGGERHGGKRSG